MKHYWISLLFLPALACSEKTKDEAAATTKENASPMLEATASTLESATSSTATKGFTPGSLSNKTFKNYAQHFLETNCVDCHDDLTTEADLNLLELGPISEENAAVWKAVWAQVAIEEMPPKKKSKISIIERLEFADWIIQGLSETMKHKGGFHAHKAPKKGNYVNHDLLFSPNTKDLNLRPTYSPKRLWRITPQEHITRLSALINTEPKYNPQKPGLRAYGDAVPTNHGGELKLYFGVDRINSSIGGTVAYATAVKSVPVVLSSMRKHGFANYAGMHTVNSAESTQILTKANDILKYMAHGPMSLVEFPEQITDNPKTYAKVRPKGDLRGLPSAITYNTKVVRPATPLMELFKDPNKKPSEKEVRNSIAFLFEMLTFRPPAKEEVDSYYNITKDTMAKLGQNDGLLMGLSAIFLDRDALFRPELAENQKTDETGRAMLQDWELGLAVNHALSYVQPDKALRDAITSGKMKTREDVKREVTRMLDNDSFRKPRVLQFFREYFDYDLAGYICKDEKALASAGIKMKAAEYHRALFEASASTDRLVELILAEDKDVFKQLLTTQKIVATNRDSLFLGEKLSTAEIKQDPNPRKRKGEQVARIKKLAAQLADLEAKLKKAPKGKKRNALSNQVKALKKQRTAIIRKNKAQENSTVRRAPINGENIHARVGLKSFGSGSLKPERTLTTAPEGQRLGILTHPSWLISHTDAMDNHAIHRGIWIRERLLGGGIPDVPITVDAQLPDEPDKTLRHRMRVTQQKYCRSCHEKIDPLGLTFENFNHVGLFRKYEKEQPVDTSGEIIDSGDPKLDGPVKDAFELINKLAESERVEQVFVRHAFRFWMGRNETLHDGPVLRDAHKAYKESGGSMKALITALVTSDAFLYRK